MLDKNTISEIIHDFTEQDYFFDIINYKEIESEDKKILWLELRIEKWSYQEGKNLNIIKEDIKKRMSNLLGLDRVIIYFNLNL